MQLSPEERQRRSDRARQMHRDGKLGTRAIAQKAAQRSVQVRTARASSIARRLLEEHEEEVRDTLLEIIKKGTRTEKLKALDIMVKAGLRVVLEILRSARSLADFERLDEALDALRSVPVGETTLRGARTAQHELARSGEHRMPPFDVLVAAAAAEAGVAVLHYDRHFDTLSRVLGFRSIWIASPGSLD